MLAVLFLPFPKGTSYGNTNVAFILLIFMVWLYRVTTRRAEPLGRTPLDIPILGLVMAYCVSFYNVQPQYLSLAWGLFLGFLTYLLIYFLILAIVKSTEDVQKLFLAQTISCVAMCLLALYEQRHPGTTLIPGWISFSQTGGGHGSGVRVGSTFLDYELFGEYCALNLFLQMFLFTRAKSRSRKYLIMGIMALTFFCLFSTVTRGAIISFLVGSGYLMWLSRHRLNFMRLVMIFALAVPLIIGADYIVANFTNSDSVLERLFGTELKGGVPETRSGVWSQSSASVLRSPWIGHGPYMAPRIGVQTQYWPHNLYIFYAYITGMFGLTFFLWFLWELWKSSRPRALSLGSGTWIEGATLLTGIMLFTFMIDQIKIEYLRNSNYSFFVWYFFAMIFVISRVAQREAAVHVPLARETDDAQPARAPTRPGRVAERPAIPRVSARPAVPRS
jgi:O-antigen ligase